MFDHLQIYDRRERALVGVADSALRFAAPILRSGRRRPRAVPHRILLLRLERIGDLVMTLEAIADVHQAAPAAEIDLVVGGWNVDLASRIRGIQRVERLDASWLSRSESGLSSVEMLRRARQWSCRGYDLAINFAPDIRGNLLLAASRIPRLAGFSSGGGGALLDVALEYDPRTHTSMNARRLVAAVLTTAARAGPARLELAAEERSRARQALAACRRPLVGVHVSGGREIKQWEPDRFAEVARRVARERGATIVLTGTTIERSLVDAVASSLSGAPILNLSGELDVPTLAAVLEQLDVLVTGDTGPMHIAAAVGTPVVAVFGPSAPERYAPSGPDHCIVRVELPCSPCNRIRLPPARCMGHVPDCLNSVSAEMVSSAVREMLDRRAVDSLALRSC